MSKKKTSAPKVVETKALLVLKGEAQEWELIETEGILKETFSEAGYLKTTSTHTIGALDHEVTSDVIIIGGQEVHAIAFEDGFVYQVGKGFRKHTQDGRYKEYVNDTFEKLTAEKTEEEEEEPKSETE